MFIVSDQRRFVFGRRIQASGKGWRAVQERPLLTSHCSPACMICAPKKVDTCKEWQPGWRRRNVVGTPSTDALCYVGPSQCFLSLYHFSLSFILMTALLTRRHAHTDSGCYLKEDPSSEIIAFGRRRKPAGGAVRCPEVSLSLHPVFRWFHLLTPPSVLLGYRVHLLTPSTRIQLRIQREQGAARVNADWLIRAADVRRGGVQCWLPLWRRHPGEFYGDFCASEDMQGPCFYWRARSWHWRPWFLFFVYSHMTKVSCHQTNAFKIPWRAF